MVNILVKTLGYVRWIIAPMVLFLLSVYWGMLVIVFSPVIFLDAIFGWTRRQSDLEAGSVPPNAGLMDGMFDRHGDVSKIYGCNTRNVKYRWDIFVKALQVFDGVSVSALDFGAGSLRDSFELSILGHHVTAFDLDPERMRRHLARYKWSAKGGEPRIVSGSLSNLGAVRFPLILAFDVLEHLDDLDHTVSELSSRLERNGLILATVPNGRSLYEFFAKTYIVVMRRLGKKWAPGAPHVNFYSPDRWIEFFERRGLSVVAHDMAIGFFLNDLCHTVFKIPLMWVVCPVVDRVYAFFSFSFDRERFIASFYPAWLAERINLIDQFLKPVFKGLFGWNLFVLKKAG